MKKRIPLSIFSLAAVFIFSTSLFAQEKTEITIQVKKDGKVVKDTMYQFDDAAEAKHAVKMLEILSGDEEHMMHFDHPHGEHVIVMKSGDGETIDVMVSEDIEMEKGKTKQVKVIVSGDEDGTWHVDSKELKEVEEEVYVISGDDAEEELKEILKDHDGENVKVIVIKKKSKEQ